MAVGVGSEVKGEEGGATSPQLPEQVFAARPALGGHAQLIFLFFPA